MGDDPPPPRVLKIFINRLGGIHRQWQDEIPLPVQAAFLLLTERLGKDFLRLLRQSKANDLLSEVLSRRLHGEWQRDLAAIYFNVELNNAYEALLAVPISNALASDDPTALSKLESSPGFFEILQGNIESLYGNSDQSNQANLASAILAVAGLQNPEPAYNFIRRLLLDRAIAILAWLQPSSKNGAALASIAKQNRLTSFDCFAEAVANSLPKDTEGMPQANRVQAWLEFVSAIVKDLGSSKPGLVFTIELSPSGYIRLLFICDSTSTMVPLAACFRFKGGQEAVNRKLLDRLQEGWEPEEISALSVIKRSVTDWSLSDFPPKILKEICSSPLDEAGMRGMLASLILLRQEFVKSSIAEVISNFDSDRFLTNYEAIGVDLAAEEDALLNTLLLVLPVELDIEQAKAGPNDYYGRPVMLPLSADVRERNQTRERIRGWLNGYEAENEDRATYNAATEFFTAKDWREAVARHDDRSHFVTEIATKALRERNRSFFSIEEALDNIDFWRAVLSEDGYAELIHLLGLGSEIANRLALQAFDVRFVSIYLLILREAFDERINALTLDHFENLSTSEWTERLEEDDNLEIRLLDSIRKPSLGVEFENAVFQLVENAADVIALPANRLFEVLSDIGKGRLLSKLATWFGTEKGDFKSLLAPWGELLRDAVKQEGIDRVQERILEGIARADEKELEWIAGVIRGRPEGSVTPRTTELFKRRTRELIADTTDESRRKNLFVFAENLGWRFNFK